MYVILLPQQLVGSFITTLIICNYLCNLGKLISQYTIVIWPSYKLKSHFIADTSNGVTPTEILYAFATEKSLARNITPWTIVDFYNSKNFQYNYISI